VQRHVSFVHGAAVRQLNGDAHLARDVAQAVFIDAARHAARLAGHPTVVGWLFTSTRFAAAKVVRAEQRRRLRERAAQPMTPENNALTDQNWEQTRPVLDRALAALPRRDREVLLLRYFEQRAYRDIGAHFALAENTARMCVERALERLRAGLAKHGITSTAAALAAGLSLEAATVPPPLLSATLATGAIAAAAGPGAWLTFMTLTKTQMIIAAAAATAGATILIGQAHTAAALDADLRVAQVQAVALPALRDESVALRRAAVEAQTLTARAGAIPGLRGQAQALEVQLADATRRRDEAEAASKAAAVIDAGGVDTLPKLTVASPPAYPVALREAGQDGRVVLQLVVDAEGHVRDPKVVQSSDAAFEPAALDAVSHWQFTPGLKFGRPVNTRLQVPVVFKLGNDRGAGSR